MEKRSILTILIFSVFLVILLYGCQPAEKKPEEKPEEAADTGVLVIGSSPSQAQVYVDAEFKGNTPLELDNMPVGTYDVVVKKEGYADFEKTVNVKAGRTGQIDAELNLLAPAKGVEEKPKEKPVEEHAEMPQPENASAPTLKSSKINLSSFAMYYDFEKAQFAETRADKSDLFSRKYDTYVHFTALTPAKIYVLNKPVKDVQKEDCIFSDNAVSIVYSGQTLCVKTIEGNVAAIGGTWQTTPTMLEWVLFG
ncbi:PEGA domain-containing protein [Candidatus Woesearchaeota archaeon]|nr:PEGA domain-containing protein [Candidatus Woesearchaeota archaeon]